VISLPFFLLTALILRKISSIKQNKIDELSTTDDLTGLLNQSGFMKRSKKNTTGRKGTTKISPF